MKKRYTGLLLIFLLFFSNFAFSESKPETKKPVAENQPMLLFFLNPNGRPCQMQAGILKQNMGEIEKHARIQGISTTVSSHRQYFYQFGIRQLPSLVLIEPSGKVIHRFSPGIHQVNEILGVINRQGKP